MIQIGKDNYTYYKLLTKLYKEVHHVAIEEHFSQDITKNERRDPIDMTNNMKITSHGFDTVYSFRNKA